MLANTRFVRGALVAVLLACPIVRAQEDAATTTSTAPPVPSKVEVSTDVQGDVPKDLVGRWLIVLQVKLASGQVRPITRTIEITQGPEHLEMALANDLPSPVFAKVSAAASAGQPWTPTEEDLRAIDQTWRPFTPDPRSLAKIGYRILGADAYPPEFQNDETTKESKFSLVIRQDYSGSQAVRNTYEVYGVQERTPTQLKGPGLSTTLAVAFVPLPITLKGDFQGYRIGAPPPSGSLLERISSFFSGCGRR
jgi:hypothetical protein